MTPKFYEPLAYASTKEQIDQAIAATCAAMGFPLYSFIYAGFSGCGGPESILVTNAPAAFAEASLDAEACKRDSVLRRLRSTTTPFIYTQATYVNDGAGDLWEEQAVFGYRSGIATAMRLGKGRRFLIGFDTPDRIPGDEPSRSMLLACLAGVAVLAAQACERIMGDAVAVALARSGSAALTRRETEVLPFLAKGMSCPEIGRALHVSARTVEKHIQAAMAKLGASRQTEMVAAAVRMGLLDDRLLAN